MPKVALKRGAIPAPRSLLAASAPYRALVGAPPNYIVKPQQISMWGNDVHGDCVTAEEAFAKACNNPEIFISDSEVIAWATSHGVLEGAYLTQVMTWMQTDGFTDGASTYDDGPYLSVNWSDPGTLQSAIAQGPVKIGVAADQIETAWRTTGGQSGWFGTGWQADSNEDHCVSLCGYGSLSWLAQQLGVQVPAGVDGTQPGYALFTWDSIGIVDVPSMDAVTHEAWLRQPTTVVVPPVSIGALYRYWNASGGDHFYTTNWNELNGGNYGWAFEGVQCYVYTQQESGTVPLFRYWNAAACDHFYTTNWNELGSGNHGWAFEEVQCYVCPSQGQGALPLYRYWNPAIADHFYTTNWSELGNGNYGWNYEGIQCYVLAGPAGSPDSAAVPKTFASELSATPSVAATFRWGNAAEPVGGGDGGGQVAGGHGTTPPSFQTSAPAAGDKPSPSFVITGSG